MSIRRTAENRIRTLSRVPCSAPLPTLVAALLVSGGCAEGTLKPRERHAETSAGASQVLEAAAGADAGGAGPGIGVGGGAAGAEAVGGSASSLPLFGQSRAQLLFEYDHVPRFDLTLPEERWADLQRNARDEEYVEAHLSFEGDEVGTVGLRFKGYATLSRCFEGDAMVCDKLSMKLRFDEYDENQRLFGLKRLAFNSMHYDQSMLHERLAYDLYRAMGVPAPRAAWATITVNGKSYGLFSMIEPVDGRFTDDRWPKDGDGNLYKEVWPTMGGDSYYSEHLKTNEDQADNSKLDAFHEDLVGATSPEAVREVLARWVDLESVYRYAAVDDAVNASDGFTTFYTDEERTWTSNHNVYFYQEEKRDRFRLIPWDLDSCFWVEGMTFVPHWTELPEDCDTIYTKGEDSGLRTAPGCDLVFQGLGADLTEYREAVDELLAGPYDEATMFAKIDEHVAFLDPAAREDPFVDTALWADKVAEVKRNIPVLRARLEAYRDGTPIHPLELVRDKPNDFDSVTRIDAMLAGAVYANSASEARLGVGEGDAGEGDVGLRFEFAYRDDPEPWTHYGVFSTPVSSASRDLTAYTGLRLRARSNGRRPLRVELVSEAHTPLANYIYEGWDLSVSAEWQTFELRFDEAVFPSWATDEDYETQNSLEDVLRGLLDLRVFAECVGRDGEGFLGEGEADNGFVSLDDLEFFRDE